MGAKAKTYFIQAVSGGPIKIGKSVDPKKRLSGIQTGSPEKLKILATINEDREGEIHNLFKDSRVIGEWFELSEELLSWILANAKMKKAESRSVREQLQVISVPKESGDTPNLSIADGIFRSCSRFISSIDEIERFSFSAAEELGIHEEVNHCGSFDLDDDSDCGCDFHYIKSIFQEAFCSSMVKRIGIDREGKTIYFEVVKPMSKDARVRFEWMGYLDFALDAVMSEWGTVLVDDDRTFSMLGHHIGMLYEREPGTTNFIGAVHPETKQRVEMLTA